MSRFEHILYPVRGNVIPNAIVAVEVIGDVVPTTTGPVMEYETLRTWHTLSGVKGDSHYEKAVSMGGDNIASFWVGLKRLCQKRGEVWVVCSCAPRVWPLLGLWEAVEDG